MKNILSLVVLILLTQPLKAHPDGATPYWYPSGYIYGFVRGCSETIEEHQVPFTENMWPDQVREVCGCVLDSLRHSLTWQEVMDNSTNNQVGMQLIVDATMPVCVDEQLKKQ